MKKAVKPIAIVTVIALIVGSLGVKVNKAMHQPPPPPRTVTTRLGEITVKVSETGTVQPVDKVDVKSKVAGRVLEIPIVEGQRVTTGQLIATVDRSQIDPQIAGLRAQLDQAQAHLQQSVAQYNLQVKQSAMAIVQAQANLKTAETHLAAVAAGARPQETAQQQEAVDRAQIALDDAQRTLKRKQSLVARGFIAQADVDSAQVAYDTAASSLAAAKQAQGLTAAGPRIQDINDARAQVDAQRVALETAQANVGQNDVSRTDIAQSRASVQEIQNQLAQLLVQQADTRIVAPASGIVLKKYKQTGEIVQSATTGFSDAQSIVATLGSRLEVQVGINEVDIPKVRVGAPVLVHIDALPNVTYVGRVTEVAPASANAFSADSGGAQTSAGGSSIAKFNVKVALGGYDSRLRPGMTADVDIVSAKHANVVLAPQEAVPDTGSQATVTVLTAAKTQEKRAVVLGLRSDTDVEIVHGLHAGEKLIVPPINGAGRRKFDVG